MHYHNFDDYKINNNKINSSINNFLIIIIINEKVNKKAIIIITKIIKNLNLTILSLNRNLKILIYRKLIIIARK